MGGEHEDTEVKKKVIRELLPYLRETLGDPCRYISYLVEGDVFGTLDSDIIKSKTTSKEKLEIFLQLLIKDREDVSTFDVFVMALEDLGVQNEVARKLRRTLAYEKEAMRNVHSAAAIDNGIQYIRNIVGNQFSEDDMIKAIKHSSMDAAAALNHLIEKATHLVTNDARRTTTATAISSHQSTSSTAQTKTATTRVQPSPGQLTPRTSYLPSQTTTNNMTKQSPSLSSLSSSLSSSTSSFEGPTLLNNQQDVNSACKQRSNIVTSSSSCVLAAQLSTAPSTRSVGTTTSVSSHCPFSAPQWNVAILSQKFDHNGGTLHIHDHDIDIVIPKDAICMGHVVEVHAAAILSGPYKIPSKYYPISVTVWVGANYKFNQLIKISIPHCAVINNPQDINGLVVLTAIPGEEEFTVNTNSRRLSQSVDQTNCYSYGVKSPYCDYYTDQLNSTVCLARRSFQLTTLSVMVFCSKPHDYQSADKLPVEFCFCYNLKHCVKSMKKAYKIKTSIKPHMSQWNIEIDSRQRQRICMSYSINVPDAPSVTRKSPYEVAMSDLAFWSHDRRKEERSNVCLPQLAVYFNRGQESMRKDITINFKIDVESDGATPGLQKGYRFSLKLDKLILKSDRHYANVSHTIISPTTATATDHSQELVKETSNNSLNTVASMASCIQDNLSNTAGAHGNVFVKNVYVIQAGHNVSLANSCEERQYPIENDVNGYNYLQSFATDIATRLDVDSIQLHMIKYGLLTRHQQEFLSSSTNTSCAKGQMLCTIVLSFDENCIEKFLLCLSDTSHYKPHRELLQKIRQRNSTV